MIRIGYGLEFDIPALVPAGLATAACEGDWSTIFFKGLSVDAKDVNNKVRFPDITANIEAL